MNSQNERPHTSVMLEETISFFAGKKLRVFYEGTVGAGGHAQAILEAHPEIERYIACDRDQHALEIARLTLAPWKEKVEFVHGNFGDAAEQLKARKIEKVDGFFLTLGFRRCKSTKVRGDLALIKRGL